MNTNIITITIIKFILNNIDFILIKDGVVSMVKDAHSKNTLKKGEDTE